MTILEKFKKSFFEKFKGAALVLSDINRFYLTSFMSSLGAVIVTEDKTFLLVDFRYYEMAKKAVQGIEVVLVNGPLLTFAMDICKREGVHAVVIEDDYVTLDMNRRIEKVFEGFEIGYFGTLFSELRAIKTEDEIRNIESAQKITDMTFEHILSFIRPGITESDVACELDYFMRKNGADGPAFKTICVSGAKSSLPHGEPSQVVLSENSFLTMDFGAKLGNYCSDMTRTVVLGRADDGMREIYDIVLEAQKRALAIIKAGVLGCDVDKAARDYISQKGFGECFGHSTGHSLGLEVHELPSFSSGYTKPIEKNTILSVEPGIYIEGKYGVRIEDIVVIDDGSYRNLTKSDKKLLEIY